MCPLLLHVKYMSAHGKILRTSFASLTDLAFSKIDGWVTCNGVSYGSYGAKDDSVGGGARAWRLMREYRSVLFYGPAYVPSAALID